MIKELVLLAAAAFTVATEPLAPLAVCGEPCVLSLGVVELSDGART